MRLFTFLVLGTLLVSTALADTATTPTPTNATKTDEECVCTEATGLAIAFIILTGLLVLVLLWVWNTYVRNATMNTEAAFQAMPEMAENRPRSKSQPLQAKMFLGSERP